MAFSPLLVSSHKREFYFSRAEKLTIVKFRAEAEPKVIHLHGTVLHPSGAQTIPIN